MSSSNGPPKGWLVSWAAMLVLTGVIVAVTAILSLSKPPPAFYTKEPGRSANPSPPLEISPDPVWLGMITAGQSARSVATLRNPGRDPVRVDRIETSCPCLRPSPNALEIGAGESASLTFDCDLSDEPDFLGRLAINVEAYDHLDRVVFRTRVNLEVRRGARTATGEPFPRHGIGRPPVSAPEGSTMPAPGNRWDSPSLAVGDRSGSGAHPDWACATSRKVVRFHGCLSCDRISTFVWRCGRDHRC